MHLLYNWNDTVKVIERSAKFDFEQWTCTFHMFYTCHLFQKLLHTPSSICTFASKQLISLNAIDSIEMSQVPYIVFIQYFKRNTQLTIKAR